MKYLLDTNLCINFLRGRTSSLKARFMTVPRSQKYLCPVVQAELYFGAYNSAYPQAGLEILQQFLVGFPVLPFDQAAAKKYGEIRAQLTRQGKLIGPYDLQIAAIALANGAVVVTHNTEEFGRVAGLEVEDWEV